MRSEGRLRDVLSTLDSLAGLGVGSRDTYAFPPIGQGATDGWGTLATSMRSEGRLRDGLSTLDSLAGLRIGTRDTYAFPPIGQRATDGWGTQATGMRSEGLAKIELSHPCAEKMAHGWGTQDSLAGLRIGSRDTYAFPPIGQRATDGWGTLDSLAGLRIETWGTLDCSSGPILGKLQDCACRRERSGWQWEWFSI